MRINVLVVAHKRVWLEWDVKKCFFFEYSEYFEYTG